MSCPLFGGQANDNGPGLPFKCDGDIPASLQCGPDQYKTYASVWEQSLPLGTHICVSPDGSKVGGYANFQGFTDTSGETYLWGEVPYYQVGFLSDTAFDGNDYTSYPWLGILPADGTGVIYEQFQPSAINNNGWGIQPYKYNNDGSYDYSRGAYWDTVQKDPNHPDKKVIQSLDGQPVAINDKNDILVGGTNPYLLEPGTAATNGVPRPRYFLQDGAVPGMIPLRAKPHLGSIYPYLMSNRVPPPTDGSVRPVLYIVFLAKIERSPNSWSWSTFLLVLYSDDSTNFFEIGNTDPNTGVFSLNAGSTTIDRLISINTSGVIAAIGNGGHALLLVPARFDAVEGQINYGFDPPMKGLPSNDPPIPDDPPDEYWASVTKGTSNQNVKLVLPKSFASSTKLHVMNDDPAQSNPYFDISPKDTPLSAAETTLTLTGLASTNGHTVPDMDSVIPVEVQAQTIGDSQKVCSLKVDVLPPRTVSVGIYRVTDSDSSLTLPLVGVPTNEQIRGKLNDVFQQAGVAFEIANITGDNGERNIHFDTYHDGENSVHDGGVQEKEYGFIVDALKSEPGKIHLIFVNNSGLQYDTTKPSSPYVRAGTVGTDSMLFVQTISEAGGDLKLISAHELGHALSVPSNERHPDDHDHDPGPFPPTTGGLMSSGFPDPITGDLPANPKGTWLPHEDWETANIAARDL